MSEFLPRRILRMGLNPRFESVAAGRGDLTATGWSKDQVYSDRKERLLIVDDEESVAYTVSEVLRREGYDVDMALSGDEAVKKLQVVGYDLILTDLHMEGVDGISVLEAIRRIAPRTIAIVLTGFASLESAVAAIRHGAYDYLIKPCVIADLKLTVRRGLDHRRLVLAEQRMMGQLREINDRLEDRIAESTAELLSANRELEEANRAKDIFFAMLSHELRTPLTAMLGWANILKRRPGEPETLEQGLAAIERNGEMLKKLINQLLDVSRMISGKLRVELEPLDLCEVVSAEVSGLEERISTLNLNFIKELPDKPLFIEGSALHLHQILSNLIANAMKYTPAGGTIQVKIHEEAGQAIVTVRDNGAGIDPKFLPRIFDLFSQDQAPGLGCGSGLGLGLAIVSKLTSLHNGSVRAQSDGPGKGSIFAVALPCSAPASKPHEMDQEFVQTNVKHSVLVIEDSQDALELFKTVFLQYGYEVLTASSGQQALSMLDFKRPAIIISDIGMPDMSGYDLMKEVRRRPGYSNIPAIAISGYATPEDRTLALAAGFVEHIPKPIDPDHLVKKVSELLS
jgi:signal transduction histidine kinase